MNYFFRKDIILFAFLVFPLIVLSQNQRALTFDDIVEWNRITEKVISNDGNFIAYKAQPWKGDAVLFVSDKRGNQVVSLASVEEAQFTKDSKYMVFKIVPKKETIRQLKLRKTKKNDMPLDKLGILNLERKTIDTISNLKSFKIPVNWNGWIAYQTRVSQDTVKNETKKNGGVLNVRDLRTNRVSQFPFVVDYILSKNHSSIAFVSKGDGEKFKPGVYFLDLINDSSILTSVVDKKGDYEQLCFSETSTNLVFLADTIQDKKAVYDLFLWKNKTTSKLFDRSLLPDGYEFSENRELKFSKDDNSIFFGIAKVIPPNDTTKLEEEIPLLDIWHWNEPVLQSEQLNNKENDLKKSLLSVYHIGNAQFIKLQEESYSEIELIEADNSEYAIAYSNLPYAVQTMWEGNSYNDFYLIDIKTGISELIKKNVRAYPRISYNGNYVFWYNSVDTSWSTYDIKFRKEYKVTNPDLLQCANEINDIPDYPGSYGIAGWTVDDAAILIYDRYDLWKIDPRNKFKPVNITKNGRINKINYRLLDFDTYNKKKNGQKITGIVESGLYLFRGHEEVSRKDYYYRLALNKSQSPQRLYGGGYKLNVPIKALDDDVYIFTRESFEIFPDLLLSNNKFKNIVRISDVNPQQKEFLWGTKELYTWTSLDGRKLSGILVKPANFDSNKKYPMIVNFYEKSSHNLYKHQIPEAHRSTIDYHYYSSNGYLIFNPDVYYKTGYPGEDAFNCVMPGITQLISEGFVDEEHIAAQGHSWGGYQVAYLATRTNLFAAIESGAPVVNMFSAYGGIRLWSGKNRSFQYERSQSRIGNSIWEKPLRYLENSPLFTVDKIQTPILIMHNENDGAVPFSQGVEFFIALRRLNKRAWLLNYNDGDHWPIMIRDKYDFQIRLAQFFDHYLKDRPMSKWMKEGIKAVRKRETLGLELVE